MCKHGISCCPVSICQSFHHARVLYTNGYRYRIQISQRYIVITEDVLMRIDRAAEADRQDGRRLPEQGAQHGR